MMAIIVEGREVGAVFTWLFIGILLVMLYLMMNEKISLKVRKLAGLEALSELVGRCAEMGTRVVFSPGVSGMTADTFPAFASGMAILNELAYLGGKYGVEVVCLDSSAAKIPFEVDNLKAGFLRAGKPEMYNYEKNIRYLPSQGPLICTALDIISTEKPGACVWTGAYAHECVQLSIAGSLAGAVQVGGTERLHYVPILGTTCDYSLIGDELYAASAYLTKDPDQLGTLGGQDIIKGLVLTIIVAGLAYFLATGIKIVV